MIGIMSKLKLYFYFILYRYIFNELSNIRQLRSNYLLSKSLFRYIFSTLFFFKTINIFTSIDCQLKIRNDHKNNNNNNNDYR